MKPLVRLRTRRGAGSGPPTDVRRFRPTPVLSCPDCAIAGTGIGKVSGSDTPTSRASNRQRDWQNPDVAGWTEALKREIASAPEAPMIIAHSFGCLATVCAAFAGANIRAALLVAPADPERFGIGAELTDKPLPFASTIVASSNDPWLKLMRAGALASIWGSQLVVYRNAGHINAESGFGPWPQGLTHVHELASRAAHRVLPRGQHPFAN